MIIDFWIITKIITLVALAIYAFFAFLVVRQVSLMTQALGTNLSTTLKVIANFHLAFTLSLLALGVLLL